MRTLVVLFAALLLAGCTSVTDGAPVSAPTTPRSSPTAPPSTPSSPSGPTEPTEDSIQFPRAATPAPATAPTNPCSMISAGNWQSLLTATKRQSARPEAGIEAGDLLDGARIAAQCTINDGTGYISLRWGYYLPGWTFAQEQKQQKGAVIGSVPQSSGDPITVYRGDAASELFAQVRGVTVYIESELSQDLRYQGRALTAMFSELVGHVPDNLFGYSVQIPAGCPAPTDATLTALVGEVTFATGYSAYGNAECDYFSGTAKRWAKLSAQNQTREFFAQDQKTAKDLGTAKKAWWPDAPGTESEVYDTGQQITVYMVVPAKYAYLVLDSGRLDTVGVPHAQFAALAVAWRTAWLPKLPAERRTR